MSSYHVLLRVSEQLQGTLWRAFQQARSDIITDPEQIVFTNPKETRRTDSKKLSLWLYRVTEDEFTKNQPMERTGIVRANDVDSGGTRTDRVAPLALNLFYLLTPMASLSNPSEVTSDLLVLGGAMQALYDHSIMQLQTPAEGVAEELRIILCRLTLEELTRVWEALQEPYRLSVCYQVRVVRLDSTRTLTRTRVIERSGRYTEPVAERED